MTSESVSVESLGSIAGSAASASLVAETSLDLLGSGADISMWSSSASLSSAGSVAASTGGDIAASALFAGVVASEVLEVSAADGPVAGKIRESALLGVPWGPESALLGPGSLSCKQ